MELSRSREDAQRLIDQNVLVSTKRPFFRKCIELLLTTVFWIYTLVVTWFFVSAFSGQQNRYIATVKMALNVNNTDIRAFMSYGVVLLLVLSVLLLGWRTYNKRRYGPLNRRKPPAESTLDELKSLELIEPDLIHKLQNERILVFEKNPVKELRKK